MKRLLWLGVLFLSASWLFVIPEFIIPDPFWGGILLFLGVCCITGGLWKTSMKHIDIRYLLLLVPLATTLFVLSYPYNLGVVVLTGGLLLVPLGTRVRASYYISAALLLAGLILLVQTAVLPFYTTFIAHGHRIDLLSPIVSWVGTLLGLHTSVNNGIVFVQIAQQTYPFTTTWEKLGLGIWLNIFLGAVILFGLLSPKRKFLQHTLIFLLASIGYLLLRYIMYIYGYLITADLSVFWNPWLTTLSFLPFSVLLMKLVPLRTTPAKPFEILPPAFTTKHLATMALVFIMVFSAVGATTFQDPGSMKSGRVLIDEYHSDWENSTRPLDTEWFGLLSTYNYYSWATWLGQYYTVSRNINHSLSDMLLDQYDIVILKCPTQSYTDPEIQALHDFVEGGGGLYLIGDHTNVFGMNTFLNQVSEQFGIRFNTDATYEIGTGNLSVYNPDPLFVHPALRHVTQFDFMTSCTIEPTSLLASMTMENIIIGNRVTSEPGTYATENFFRESIGSPDSEYGYLLQAAAMKQGSGRIVAFTDSTVFSSFSMFTDGYPGFTLGVMEYLNRTNTYAFVNAIFLAIAALSFILLLFLLRKGDKTRILWMSLFAGLLAFSIAAPSFTSLEGLNYPLPHAYSTAPQICFDLQHSSIDVSTKPNIIVSNSNNYGTFYVWTQRVGYIPSQHNRLKDALAQSDVVVIINPVQSFSPSEITAITRYLQQGGRLLLMDSITNIKSTANELLGDLGMWITVTSPDHAVYQNETLRDSNASVGALVRPYLVVTGGQPLLITGDNETSACMTTFSNTANGSSGKLIVVVDSYGFSDAVMGGPYAEPNTDQKQIYQTEFSLLNELLKP